ncbi:hypothetical protein PAJ20_09185, partial [Campylobacter jejuni]|nr:hypothetical protein [Campylobacter jejuni]
ISIAMYDAISQAVEGIIRQAVKTDIDIIITIQSSHGILTPYFVKVCLYCIYFVRKGLRPVCLC